MAIFNPEEIRIPESPEYTWLQSARIELFEGQIHSIGGGIPRFWTKEELASMDPARYRLVHTPESIENLGPLNLDEYAFMSDEDIDEDAFVELVMRAEEAFGITIPEEECEWVSLDSSYSEFLALIRGKLTQQAMVVPVGE